jgi:hypothetical protein
MTRKSIIRLALLSLIAAALTSLAVVQPSASLADGLPATGVIAADQPALSIEITNHLVFLDQAGESNLFDMNRSNGHRTDQQHHFVVDLSHFTHES